MRRPASNSIAHLYGDAPTRTASNEFTWRSGDGRVASLRELTPAHRASLHEYLLRNAGRYLDTAVHEGRFAVTVWNARSWLRSLPLVMELERLIEEDNDARFISPDPNSFRIELGHFELGQRKTISDALREETQVTELILRKDDVVKALEGAAATAQAEYDTRKTRVETDLTTEVAALPFGSKERLLLLLTNPRDPRCGDGLELGGYALDAVNPADEPSKLARTYAMAAEDTVTVTDTDAVWRYL